MVGYINWREEPGEPKPRKVPFDPVTGQRIDPHDQSKWRTYDDCVATGHRVGMVLSDADPYFLLDLDAALDSHSGHWHDWAVQICAQFPGAFCEISVSGTGLHIMGRCDAQRLGPRRHKWFDGRLEWYCTGRFVALGQGAQGNIDIDWTDTLDRLVPVRDVPDTATLSDVYDPAYTLADVSDDDVLAMALNSRGSAAGVMGDRATFRQLWEADTEALRKFFPPADGAGYDASSADVALVSQLAFWCGKNAARMDRLFRRSRLMRDKWEREDYRRNTLQRGVTGVTRVYDKVRDAEAPRGVTFGDYLRVDDQVQHFAGCVYISEEHAVLTPWGEIMKPDRFKSWFGGYEFQMSLDGSKPTRNAFEAFTESRAHKFPKVLHRTFDPSQPFGTIIGTGVNTYRDPQVLTTNDDCGPFLDLMKRLVPDANDRGILLAWMAATVQYPGRKFQWAPVIQGTKGNGKSFLGNVLAYCVGREYAHSPKPDKMIAQFNGFLLDKLLIIVEEIHMYSKRETLEKLKDYITGSWQEIERKGVDSRMVETFANWIFFTNHKDAMIVERDDRRFAVIFTAQQTEDDVLRDMPGDYFPRLWDWARAGGFAAIRGYLARYAIPDVINPAKLAQRAPKTSSRDEAVTQSYGTIEQHVLEAIAAERQGFRDGWISTWAVTQLLDERRVKNAPRSIASALENIGYVSTIRATTPILQEGSTKPRLYRVSGTGVGSQEDYLQSQGYRSMPRVTNGPVSHLNGSSMLQ